MSFGGSVSAMISSLKYNNSQRRNKGAFSKQSDFSDLVAPPPLSKEENLRIIQENKDVLRIQTRTQRVTGVILIMLIGAIIFYGIQTYNILSV